VETYISPWHVADRITAPDDPGYDLGYESELAYAYWQLGYGDVWRDGISPYSALTYSAVWACVRYISQSIASLGWHVYQRSGENGQSRERLPLEENIAWTLGMQASPEMSAFDWRQVMLKDALLWGNGYAEIERTGGGRVLWLWHLDAGRVCPERDDAGNLYYRVSNPEAGDSILAPEDVFHLKGVSPDGVIGYSVVSLARHSIRLGLAEERYGSEFFSRGPTPGGILKVLGKVPKAERDAMRDSFMKTYGGAKNAGKVVVLNGDIDFHPLSLPNEDAQFLESRSFQVNEIARWFGVPPHKLADLSRATFSNIEHQSIEAVQDCLLPWCRRLETEADLKLFGERIRGRRYCSLNLATLLRGDSKTQTENLTRQVASALRTPNEARAMLELNPDPDGDTLMVQGAMVPLERAVEPPQPPPPPTPPPPAPESDEENEDSEDEDMPEALQRTVTQLLAEVYGHFLRVDQDKARRAANGGRLWQWAMEYYTPEKIQSAADQLRPVVAAALLAAGRPVAWAERIARELAGAHTSDSRSAAAAGKVETNGRAGRQAEAHARLIWEAIR
jgi:HK97 family phage portal protein